MQFGLGSSGDRSLVGRAGAINNSGKNRTPLELGRVEKRIRGGSIQPVVVLPSVHARRVGVLDDPRVLKNLVEWQPLRRVLDQHLCTTIDEVLNLNSNFLYETREKLKTSYLRNQILRGR